MDILLLLFIFFILCSTRWYKIGNFNEGYLSMDNCGRLRGMMAITIILHHISEKTSGAVLFPQLVHVGYMIVAIFFFLSGYGLMFQYMKKGVGYLQGFWKSRVLYLLLVYAWITGLYIIYRTFVLGNADLNLVLRSFYDGNPIATNSWYIVVLLAFYAIFWFSFNHGGAIPKCIVLVTVSTVLFSLLLWVVGYPSIWYLSNFAFPLGLFYAYKKEKILSYCTRRYVFVIAVLLLTFGIACTISSVFATMFVACSVTLIVIVLMMKFRFVGKIWSWIGSLSLEIYLLHAIPMTFFRSKFVYIDNDVNWTLCVVLTAIALAFCSKYINLYIHSQLKKQ